MRVFISSASAPMLEALCTSYRGGQVMDVSWDDNEAPSWSQMWATHRKLWCSSAPACWYIAESGHPTLSSTHGNRSLPSLAVTRHHIQCGVGEVAGSSFCDENKHSVFPTYVIRYTHSPLNFQGFVLQDCSLS